MSVKAKYFDTDVNIVLTISKDAAPAPSTEPTAEPTVEPSAEPTVEPSAEPTAEPEPSPGNAPAEKGEETYALEDAPEASSAPAATTEPTAEPSPSAEPTAQPTTEPISEPAIESADTAEITVKVFGNGIKTGEKVTITTATSGGSGTVTGGGEYEIGDVVILTADGRFGYWIIDGKKYSEENPLRYTATKDETITAHFYKKGGGSLNSNYAYHTVRFDSNGGTNISDIKVANNTVAKQPEDPKRSGYEFTGWYSDKELKTRYTFKDRVFESMTLYAGWEKVSGNNESALPFTDVKESDWYYRAVEVMYNNDIMQGMTATRFEPNTKLTRAMFVTVLYRAEGEPSSNAKSGFGDVASNAWYAKAVAWAVKNNIVSGYDDDTFAPNDEITREQMAAIIYRYAKYTGYDMNGAADIKGFKDYADVSDWALAAVKWAVDIDILSGMDNNTLQPKGSATRAQCASILMRCSETLKLMDIETEE